MLRGSRNFNSRNDYEKFLKDKFNQINSNRLDKVTEEMKHLRELPLRRIEDYREFSIKVSPGSTIRINNNTYSVHSRLIKEHVKVLLYADHLKVYYGQSLIEEIPRLVGDSKNHIQYRHIIDSLIRKPGAFENYKYKDDMFPTSHFKITFDLLKEQNPVNANKEYLKILNLAAKESEDQVDKALMISIDADDDISFTGIEKIVLSESACDFSFPIEISPVDLKLYDALLEEPI